MIGGVVPKRSYVEIVSSDVGIHNVPSDLKIYLYEQKINVWYNVFKLLLLLFHLQELFERTYAAKFTMHITKCQFVNVKVVFLSIFRAR